MRPAKKFNKGLLPALLCFMALLIAACGPTPPSQNTQMKAAANKQVYIAPVAGVSDFGTLDPALVKATTDIQAIDMVFTGLVELDDNLKVQPQLAQSYQVMPDGLTYKFTLRPSLKFSDGTPLTSADVAYSIDRALQPALKSSVSPAYLGLVKDADQLLAGKIQTIIGDSILTPDASTVIIITKQKAAYFLATLTYPDSYVVEKSLITKYGTQWTDHLTEGGGTGPFKVKEYTHSQRIVFVPNPNYYGAQPQLQEVIFPFYKSSDTAYAAYQAGQIDASEVPSAEVESVRKLAQEYHRQPTLGTFYYTMNYLVKPFNNIHIRQAFALAINKDLIVHAVWKDQFVPTNHIVPEGMPGYNPNLTGPAGVKGTTGDPVMAKKLLQEGMQEEGYSSISQVPPITLTFASGSNVAVRNEVTALVQMWQDVLGITVKQNDIDANDLFYKAIPSAANNPQGLQFWRNGWGADYPDPQNWLTLQFDNGVPKNTMNYGQNQTADATQQQAVQQQLEAADTNADPNARIQAYELAEQQLVNDVTWLPIEQVATSTVRKPCVVGIEPNALFLRPPDDWGKIYISTDTSCANATVG